MLEGLRALEVATYTFVPTAGAVLSDWGVDVIKVEHPVTGDPQRGVMSSGIIPGSTTVNHLVEQTNRGKRDVGIDLAHPAGRELVYRLAESSDVFLTSFLPEARQRLQIDVEHIRARNPDIIYAMGSGYGGQGPDGAKGGYDQACFWARSGLAYMNAPMGATPVLHRPAFGDTMAGLALAGGIAAAIAKRERTGEASVVDLSLLGLGLWGLQFDVVLAGILGAEVPRFDFGNMPNPIANIYETADGRHIMLVLIEADRHWPQLCRLMDRPELIEDPRFETAALRGQNREACIEVLREVFRSRPLNEWERALADLEGVWSVVQSLLEVHADEQVRANGFLSEVKSEGLPPFKLVASPVRYDHRDVPLERAPEHGEHTEEILLEAGLSWDEISDLKAQKAIL